MTTEAIDVPEIPVPSDEQIVKSIEALGHSADLINKLIEAGDKTDDSIGIITRNYQHLEIMLAKDYIQAAGADLSASEAAIVAAKAFIA